MQQKFKTFMPLGIFIGILAMVWITGLHQYISFQTIAEHQMTLENYVTDNIVIAILTFMLVYIAAVALSLPGGTILSLLGGLLFGGLFGGIINVVAATIGAVILFLIAKTSIGDTLRKKTGKWMEKIAAEFNDGAASYLLFLRLVPIFPFLVVNLAPALLGARFWTFCWTTFIGIIPGTLAFSFVGAGIGSVLSNEQIRFQQCIGKNGVDACEFSINIGSIFSQELLIGLSVMGIVALIPIIIKKFKKPLNIK